MERKYKSRSPSHKPTEVIDSERVRPRREKDRLREEIQDEMDDILSEIDKVLEDNAEEIVTSFRQYSGQ